MRKRRIQWSSFLISLVLLAVIAGCILFPPFISEQSDEKLLNMVHSVEKGTSQEFISESQSEMILIDKIQLVKLYVNDIDLEKAYYSRRFELHPESESNLLKVDIDRGDRMNEREAKKAFLDEFDKLKEIGMFPQNVNLSRYTAKLEPKLLMMKDSIQINADIWCAVFSSQNNTCVAFLDDETGKILLFGCTIANTKSLLTADREELPALWHEYLGLSGNVNSAPDNIVEYSSSHFYCPFMIQDGNRTIQYYITTSEKGVFFGHYSLP